MASRLNPYLMFDGTARTAMEFYESVFGGTLTINTFGEYGADGPEADGVMHALLETTAGFTLMASDLPPGMEQGPTSSNGGISVSGDADEELRGYWEKLSADSEVTMPLEKQMWGDEFGSCTDRFGVSWMVNITGSAVQA